MPRVYNLQSMEYSIPNAAVLVEERYLFFITMYNNILYKLDLHSGRVEEKSIPIGRKAYWAYRNLVYYKGKILFITFKEQFMLEYDIIEGNFNIVFNELFGSELIDPSFRDCIKNGEDLVLLQSWGNQMVIVNLEHKDTLTIIPLFQNAEENLKYTCVSLKQYKDCILVFLQQADFILKVDYRNGEIEKIFTKHSFCFAEVYEDDVYYFSSTSELDGIYRMNLKTLKIEMMGEVAYYCPEDIKTYRFWNNKRIGNKLFFLPHETSELIEYNLISNEVYHIKPFNDVHVSLRPNQVNAVYDLIPFKDGYIVIPFCGNTISLLNKDGEIVESHVFPVSKKFFVENALQESSLIYEGEYALADFLEYIKSKDE